MPTIRCCLTPRLLSFFQISFLLLWWFSPLAASAANLTGLSITPQNPTLNINDTLQLVATGIYDDGTQQVMAQAKQVSAGFSHTCALSVGGTVRCWGNNDYGQLGNGTTILQSAFPVAVSGIGTAVAVSVGDRHTCAVLANGKVLCWGLNHIGQLGNGGTTSHSSVPVTVSGISTAVAISAGYAYSCALLADGTIQCWGNNGSGQLGNGTTTGSSIPVTVSGISTAVAISTSTDYNYYSSGSDHTCALLIGGSVQCWGANYLGQLGNGGTTSLSSVPVTVSGISTAVAISAGRHHSCSVLTNGTIQCWGYNGSGQLGNGSTINSFFPVNVSGISTAVAVSPSYESTCAVLANGTVQCWGANYAGQLGNGETTISLIPVAVSGINNAVAISTTPGHQHTCVVLVNGTLQCWGTGELGNGMITRSLLPIAVDDIRTALTVSAGYVHSCTLLADGTVQCWGNNTFGQLGNGTTAATSTRVAVSGISSAVAIGVGIYHTCALLASGKVQCWGLNNVGQLGNGTTMASLVPIDVSGISTAKAISTGPFYSCAVLVNGTVRCWGVNLDGQLGNGTTTSSSLPVTVSNISTAVTVRAGNLHACALLSNSRIQCWGNNNSGQLGNGTTTNSSSPVTVNGISTAVTISAGYAYSCALLADGTIQCWGNNGYGQLGNGTTNYIPNPVPVTVSDIKTAVDVSAGRWHTCAVLVDRTLRCWGSDTVPLGDGAIYNGPGIPPVIVYGISTAVGVSAGYAHTCGVLTDGTIWCWGSNDSGQLGKPVGRATYLTPTSTINYFPLAWTSTAPAIATVNSTGQAKAIAPGSAQITASLNGLSASTTVTVSNTAPRVPTVTGLWPGTGTPGTIVFVFGSNFVSGQTQVKANTVSADLVQVLAPDLLLFVLPTGNTTGPVTVTTPSGSATSTGIFGTPPTGLSLTGFWPGTSKIGGFVFVFGSGYVVNQTQVMVNGVSASLRQVLDPNLLIFMVPPGASTGPIGVTTPNGSVTSSGMLTIAP